MTESYMVLYLLEESQYSHCHHKNHLATSNIHVNILVKHENTLNRKHSAVLLGYQHLKDLFPYHQKL